MRYLITGSPLGFSRGNGDSPCRSIVLKWVASTPQPNNDLMPNFRYTRGTPPLISLDEIRLAMAPRVKW